MAAKSNMAAGAQNPLRTILKSRPFKRYTYVGGFDVWFWSYEGTYKKKYEK
jgi:hypothetical protein